MKRTPFFLTAGAAAALAFSVCRDARAVDVEVAAMVGGGTTPTGNGSAPLMAGDPAGAPNPLGFGVGGRAGIVFFHGLYAGVEGMYYVGNSGSPPYYLSVNSDLLGGDVGYGFTLSRVTIRPLLGIGVFTERVNQLEEPGGPAGSGGVAAVPVPSSQSASYDTLYLQPGLTVLVSLDGHWFVGADANGLFLTSLPQTFDASASTGRYGAFTLHAQFGARF